MTRSKKMIRRIFARIGVGFTSAENLQSLELKANKSMELEYSLGRLRRALAILEKGDEPGRGDEAVTCLQHMASQLAQDVFALSELGFKRNGYFVEFGATNGIDLSNTYLLEKKYQWSGILAEPAKRWHDELVTNRSCIIEKSCVWSRSGEQIEFLETRIGELSTINSYSAADGHAKSREGGLRYLVNTISLMDLLQKHSAPEFIDYLSIDTEGSEYEILKAFDFSKYRFGVITCEHNFTPAREAVFQLLRSHGYTRKHQELSFVDDWYVRAVH